MEEHSALCPFRTVFLLSSGYCLHNLRELVRKPGNPDFQLSHYTGGETEAEEGKQYPRTVPSFCNREGTRILSSAPPSCTVVVIQVCGGGPSVRMEDSLKDSPKPQPLGTVLCSMDSGNKIWL